MRYKIVFFILLGLLLSACSATNSPKPKTNNVSKDNNITVITEVEDSTPVITPIEHTKIVKKRRDKYNFKPEPFSLESNEDDPELLGPQTTLSNRLKEKEDKANSSDKKL